MYETDCWFDVSWMSLSLEIYPPWNYRIVYVLFPPSTFCFQYILDLLLHNQIVSFF